MPSLLLVRHGQASFGSSNYDVLSPRGIHQSELVGAALRGRVAPAVVVTGGLVRQQDTAEHLVAAAGFDTRAVVDTGWDEYDHMQLLRAHASRFTALRTGVSALAGDNRRVQESLDAALLAWHGSAVDDSPGLTWPDFRDGAMASLESALAGGPALVVSSGGVIAAICATLLGLDGAGFVKLNRVSVNTGITTIIGGRTGTNLLSYNEHAHLAGDRELLTYR